MSLLIAVYVNEGIVLASDRRTTYNNTENANGKQIVKFGVHITNSTEKTFFCPNGVGISTCGDSSIMGKPITGFIQEMIRTRIADDCKIGDIPQIIINYFNELSQTLDTEFIVAGYNTEGSHKEQKIYKVYTKINSVEEVKTNIQGAIWAGETFTLTRLLTNVAHKGEDNEYYDLPCESILFEYFTLQDAIDFARYAVETTIQTMRFKNVIETVGGDIDILVITPDETKWLQKTSLQ